MSLQQKKVVVLGGTSGIGLAVAEAAVKAGAEVIVASSNAQRATDALNLLRGTAKGYPVDLTNEAEVAKMFIEIGPFDHLVYTAGESLVLSPISEMSLATLKKFFELRYFGAVTAVKEAVKYLTQAGSIVFTTGIVAARPQPGWSAGASICSAMEGLTRALAVELAPVRVNAVSPGIVKTNLWSNMSETERAALYDSVGKSLPVGRVGEAADIAQTYLYLMNEGFSTGQVLTVDGGAVLV